MDNLTLKKKVLFVTGTGTDVGKTFVCGLLLGFLKESGIRVNYQKWVSTGDRNASADLLNCLATADLRFVPELLDLQVPYRFELPASPHLAAEREGRQVDPQFLIKSCLELSEKCELLVVEGVGGALVPLRRDLLLADLVAELRLPTLVVAESGLGTLNHTLLTIEALRKRNIPLLGVVLTDTCAAEDETIILDNLRTVAELGQVRVFGRLPWADNRQEAVASFQAFGPAILQEFKMIT